MALGYEILIVSQDLPVHLRKMRAAHKLDAKFYSDPPMHASTAFGLSFVEANEGYYGMLEKHTGMDHHLLPVPAVYIVGADKIIDFVYTNVNYRARLAPEVVLSAAKSFVPTPEGDSE